MSEPTDEAAEEEKAAETTAGEKPCDVNDPGEDGEDGDDDRHFTPDEQAVIDLAREAKKAGGLTPEEAEALKEFAGETRLPVRGPESHPGRPFGKQPHIHIGPVNHIPIK